MTIRTIVFENGQATIGVGGGITIDSVPEAELEETKLKAKALLLALGAEDPWAGNLVTTPFLGGHHTKKRANARAKHV
jgi:hypothetical protein